MSGEQGEPEVAEARRRLRVSARSNPHAVAGAFAGVVREQGRADVVVVGAGALNQAVKAVAIARGFLASEGIDLVCAPEFADVLIDSEQRTALRLLIEDRAADHFTGPGTTAPQQRPLSSEA